jgi:hypothetical protein
VGATETALQRGEKSLLGEKSKPQSPATQYKKVNTNQVTQFTSDVPELYWKQEVTKYGTL